MKIDNLPQSPKNASTLNPLVFTGINDIPNNPRLGLGYHQLYDPAVPVSLIAKLPNVTRVGDTVVLYWDLASVQTYNLDQSIIDKGWLSFNVSPSVIKEPSGSVYYTLYDNQSNDLQTSEERIIAVNKRPPGGLDPDPDTAINDNLIAATITPALITDANALVTVTVAPWTYMETGDELTILWNGIRVEHPKLGAAELNKPVAVVIPKATLEQGGSNTKLPVTYEIRDSVDNYSLVSLTAFADVDIDPNAVAAPRVREADPQTLILDLEALGENDGHVLIPRYAGMKAGDKVTLTWIGKIANSEDTFIPPAQTIQDPDFDPMPVFVIPNARLKAIAGGSAMASYQVLHTDGTTLQSKRTAITLTGLPVALTAPTISGVTGNQIDLVTFKDDPVDVVIATYRGKQVGDKISLIWTGTQQNGTPVNYTADYIVKAGEENSEYRFEVLREQNLAPLSDGSLILKYQVVLAGTTSPFDSPLSQFTVKGATQIIDDFSTHNAALIRQGQSISTQYTTIRFISGPGQLGFPVNGGVPPGAAPVIKLPLLHVCYQHPSVETGTQTVQIDLNRACIQIECDIYGSNGGVTISMLDQAGNEIANTRLPVQVNQHFSFPSPTRPIHFLRIVAEQDWTYWDNITMTVEPTQMTTGMSTTLTTEQSNWMEESPHNAASGKMPIMANYPAPKVEPVNAFGVLEPDVNDAVNKTYVVIDPPVPAPFLVLFYWNGDTTSIPAETSTGTPIRAKVPAALVIAAASKTINVIYSVLDPTSTVPVPSAALSLVVGTYTAPVYPKLVITEATGPAGARELDVSKLTANANATLAAWPGQAVGQQLWLSVVSTPAITLEDWNPLNVTTLGVQRRTLALDKLKTLTNGSTLTLRLEASFDNGVTRFPFSEESWTIKQEPTVKAVAITSVKDSKGVEIPSGTSTTDTSIAVSGTVTFT